MYQIQGWLELASARHSMGASRVNTVLLDHKFHPAATTLLVTQDEGKGIYQFIMISRKLPVTNDLCKIDWRRLYCSNGHA